MITKHICPDSFDFGVPAAALLPLFSKGVDRGFMEKRAATFDSDLGKFQVKPGYTYIHLITTGAMERYGSNSNGDAFPKEARLQKAVHSYRPGVEAIMLDGGLLKYHNDTFTKLASVFKNHQNSHKGGKPSGYIVKAAYNEDMDRGELIVGLETDKWDKELQKMAEEKPIFFSMACFEKGAQVLLSDNKYKAIEDIKEGDKVKTHKGNTGIVSKTSRIEHSSIEMVSVKASGVSNLCCTSEHPFMVLKREHLFKGPRMNSFEDIDISKMEWLPASALKEGDYLVCPLNTEVEELEYVSPDFARLCGWYLAEGYIVLNKDRSPIGIRLIANEHDDFLKDIKGITEKLEAAGTFRFFEETKVNMKAVTCSLYDSEIASTITRLCGRFSKLKQLDEDIFKWSKSNILTFLGAYHEGDGCVSSWGKGEVEEREGCWVASFSTASEKLAYQLQRLCAKCGMVGSISVSKHSTSAVAQATAEGFTLEYILRLTKESSRILAPYSRKLKDLGLDIGPGRRTRFILGDYLFASITEVESELRPSVVYNMTVDHEDHSFVVNNVSVHNCDVEHDTCSYCLHPASRRSDYCDHLKNNMNMISKEGHKICAINDTPMFHDISGVVRPADKIAIGLRKVAGEGDDDIDDTPSYRTVRYLVSRSAGPCFETLKKLADIEKRILLAPAGSAEKTLIGSFKDEGGFGKCCDKDIESLGMEDPGDIFTALKDKQVVLPFDVFMKLLMGSRMEEAAPHMEAAKIELPGIFGKILKEGGLSDFLEDGSYEPSGIHDVGVYNKVDRLLPALSLQEGAIRGRIVKSALAGNGSNSDVMYKQASIQASPEGSLLAREYARYVLSFADGLPKDRLDLTVAQTIANVR